ncbi:MAG: TIGR00296 family protein [Thermoplasmata archaeon]
MQTDPDGIAAVRLARRAVAASVGAPDPSPRPAVGNGQFDEPRGVFVTLRRHPSGALRGCIGYPLPRYPLGTAIERAAEAAATEDPRFPPVRAVDLLSLTVEVSVLTVPEPLRFTTPEEAVRAVRVGRDGLMVEGRGSSGLLLPQVAPEQGWDAQQLLDGTCEKAGLPPRAWRSPGLTIYRFQAEVFAETSPAGDIVRLDEQVTPPAGRRAR